MESRCSLPLRSPASRSGAVRLRSASPRCRRLKPSARARSHRGTREMVKYRLLPRVWTLAATLAGFSVACGGGGGAGSNAGETGAKPVVDDAYLAMAKDYIAKVTAPGKIGRAHV